MLVYVCGLTVAAVIGGTLQIVRASKSIQRTTKVTVYCAKRISARQPRLKDVRHCRNVRMRRAYIRRRDLEANKKNTTLWATIMKMMKCTMVGVLSLHEEDNDRSVSCGVNTSGNPRKSLWTTVGLRGRGENETETDGNDGRDGEGTSCEMTTCRCTSTAYTRTVPGPNIGTQPRTRTMTNALKPLPRWLRILVAASVYCRTLAGATSADGQTREIIRKMGE